MSKLCEVYIRVENWQLSGQLLKKHLGQLMLHEKGKARKDPAIPAGCLWGSLVDAADPAFAHFLKTLIPGLTTQLCPHHAAVPGSRQDPGALCPAVGPQGAAETPAPRGEPWVPADALIPWRVGNPLAVAGKIALLVQTIRAQHWEA